jgi:hypothetical protein
VCPHRGEGFEPYLPGDEPRRASSCGARGFAPIGRVTDGDARRAADSNGSARRFRVAQPPKAASTARNPSLSAEFLFSFRQFEAAKSRMPTGCPKSRIQERDRFAEGAWREVHVPEGHRERRVTHELLDRLRSRSPHGEVRAEGMPEHVRSDAAEPGSLAGEPKRRLDGGLGEGASVPSSGNPCARPARAR